MVFNKAGTSAYMPIYKLHSTTKQALGTGNPGFSCAMKTDTSVATSGGVTQGEKKAAEDRVKADDGVRKTKKWWWEDGPVDSCCFCCPLRTGVGLLAAGDLLGGLWCTFFMVSYLVSNFQVMLRNMQSHYELDCGGSAATTASCEELKESMDRAAGDVQLFLHLPMVVYVQGSLTILAGAVGLWGIFQKRTSWAVKVYVRSWPPRFLLAVLVALRMHSARDKYHVPVNSDGMYWLMYTCLVVYYFKVSWSYYQKRLDHEERPHGQANQGDTVGGSSFPVDEQEPMLPMSNSSSV